MNVLVYKQLLGDYLNPLKVASPILTSVFRGKGPPFRGGTTHS